ncbi:MAG: hypothetical protein H0U73_13335 [Tatlockia sp.]|nr:hypothetical protein [Tatlockia sp.]
MNNELLRYKSRFLTFVLLLGYAFIHTQLTGLYSELSLSGFIDFSVRLPYGQRLLVPALANLAARVLPLAAEELFFLLELLFITLFYFAMKSLMQREFDLRQAQFLSWLFILLLPLITVVNYRFRTNGIATFFYPSDTSTLFFMAIGLLLCLRSQWLYFIPWVFLATLNRESSILLVLIIPALYWQTLKTVLKPMAWALLAYLLARLLILQFLHGIPGELIEWRAEGAPFNHFRYNLLWLMNGQNILLFIFCFAGLPFFWFAFFDFIPLQYRPLRYIALFYFLGLLMVGRFMEARIFSEIVVLLYLPVCIALKNWLSGFEPIVSDHFLAYYINRYAVLSLLFATVILHQLLYHLVL